MTLLAEPEVNATGDIIPARTSSTLIFPITEYASHVYIRTRSRRFPMGYAGQEFVVYEAVPTPLTPGYFV